VSVWIWTLLSVTAVSLVSLLGLASLPLEGARVQRLAATLVSFAVGALLGDAFIHLVPDVFRERARPLGPSLLVLGGVLLFFVLEKFLRHRHGPLGREQHSGGGGLPELALVNLAGDAIHNFVDGVLIAASYLASPMLGLSTTLAVLLHEIPQELGDFSVLVHSGVPVRRALGLNLASASAAILGSLVTLLTSTVTGLVVTDVLLPVTAGGFVYIAAADLIPELHRDRSLRGLFVQVALVSLGIAVMALLTLVEARAPHQRP